MRRAALVVVALLLAAPVWAQTDTVQPPVLYTTDPIKTPEQLAQTEPVPPALGASTQQEPPVGVILEMTVEEAQAALDLWDAGVKLGGIRSAPIGAILLQKMQAAIETYNAAASK